jgi:uncharacterized phiE125 gp8 family phage protein
MYFPYEEQSRVDVLPVSLAYAKEYLHIDSANTAHDTTITRMLKAARDFFEGATNNSLTEITWKTFRDNFLLCFELRKTPLLSISSIQYFDENGVLQTINSSDYLIRPMIGYDFIQFKEAFAVPSFSEDFGWPIEIVFKAGYTNQEDAIPEDIADALLAHVAKLFKNRGDAFEFTALAGETRRFVPRTTKLAILKYKVEEVGGIL